MNEAFAAADIYRVMLGAVERDVLLNLVNDHRLPVEGALRQMRCENGDHIWICIAFIEGELLATVKEHAALSVIQIDNVSDRLRARPSQAEAPAAKARAVRAA